MPGYPNDLRGEYMRLRAEVSRLLKANERVEAELERANRRLAEFKDLHPEVKETRRGEVYIDHGAKTELPTLSGGAGNHEIA